MGVQSYEEFVSLVLLSRAARSGALSKLGENGLADAESRTVAESVVDATYAD